MHVVQTDCWPLSNRHEPWGGAFVATRTSPPVTSESLSRRGLAVLAVLAVLGVLAEEPPAALLAGQ